MEPFVTRIGDVTIERVLPKQERRDKEDGRRDETVPENMDLEIFLKPPLDKAEENGGKSAKSEGGTGGSESKSGEGDMERRDKRKSDTSATQGSQKKKKKRELGEEGSSSDSDSSDNHGGDSSKQSSIQRKLSNMRRNIREVMNENQLDEETLAAQRQELERLRRVQEQQRIIREVQKQIMLNKQQKPRVISLLQSNSLLRQCVPSGTTVASTSGNATQVRIPSTVLVKLASGQGNKKVVELLTLKKTGISKPTIHKSPFGRTIGLVAKPRVIAEKYSESEEEEDESDSDVHTSSSRDGKSSEKDSSTEGGIASIGKAKRKDVVTISSSDEDDDCILISEPSGEESEVEEDPSNSGMHTNDLYNVPDDQGRVLVNVGHPPNEPDIFLAHQIARVIKPHQIGGVRFLFDNVVESLDRFSTSTGFGCILAHSMGLGKTLQVVSFCDVFLNHTAARTVLCIMPINTLQNWVAEFNIWLPSDPHNSPLAAHGDVKPRSFPLHVINDSHKSLGARSKVIKDWNKDGGVLLIGYELYRQLSLKRSHQTKKKKRKRLSEVIDVEEDDRTKLLLDEIHSALVRPGPDLVICDEGHRIKNSHASISQALKQIRSKRRVVLTGYPLQNNLLEYWCMVDFVRPNYLGTKTEFCNMFERPIQNGQCIDSTPQDIRLMRYRAHVLHSLLEGFVQRRSHSVLQVSLPQKEEYVLLLRMTKFQRELYDKFMNEVVRTKAVPNPLKAFAVCCKIWNHPDILYYFLKKRGEDCDLDLEETADGTRKGGKNIKVEPQNIKTEKIKKEEVSNDSNQVDVKPVMTGDPMSTDCASGMNMMVPPNMNNQSMYNQPYNASANYPQSYQEMNPYGDNSSACPNPGSSDNYYSNSNNGGYCNDPNNPPSYWQNPPMNTPYWQNNNSSYWQNTNQSGTFCPNPNAPQSYWQNAGNTQQYYPNSNNQQPYCTNPDGSNYCPNPNNPSYMGSSYSGNEEYMNPAYGDPNASSNMYTSSNSSEPASNANTNMYGSSNAGNSAPNTNSNMYGTSNTGNPASASDTNMYGPSDSSNPPTNNTNMYGAANPTDSSPNSNPNMYGSSNPSNNGSNANSNMYGSSNPSNPGSNTNSNMYGSSNPSNNTTNTNSNMYGSSNPSNNTTNSNSNMYGSSNPSNNASSTNSNMYGSSNPSNPGSNTNSNMYGSSNPSNDASSTNSTNSSMYGSSNPSNNASGTTSSMYGSSNSSNNTSNSNSSIYGSSNSSNNTSNSNSSMYGSSNLSNNTSNTNSSMYGSSNPSNNASNTNSNMYGSSNPSNNASNTSSNMYGSSNPSNSAPNTNTNVYGSSNPSTNPTNADTNMYGPTNPTDAASSANMMNSQHYGNENCNVMPPGSQQYDPLGLDTSNQHYSGHYGSSNQPVYGQNSDARNMCEQGPQTSVVSGEGRPSIQAATTDCKDNPASAVPSSSVPQPAPSEATSADIPALCDSKAMQSNSGTAGNQPMGMSACDPGSATSTSSTQTPGLPTNCGESISSGASVPMESPAPNAQSAVPNAPNTSESLTPAGVSCQMPNESIPTEGVAGSTSLQASSGYSPHNTMTSNSGSSIPGNSTGCNAALEASSSNAKSSLQSHGTNETSHANSYSCTPAPHTAETGCQMNPEMMMQSENENKTSPLSAHRSTDGSEVPKANSSVDAVGSALADVKIGNTNYNQDPSQPSGNIQSSERSSLPPDNSSSQTQTASAMPQMPGTDLASKTSADLPTQSAATTESGTKTVDIKPFAGASSTMTACSTQTSSASTSSTTNTATVTANSHIGPEPSEPVKGFPEGRFPVEIGAPGLRGGREDPGIPYDWATELLKGYVPGSIENSAKMEVFFCILEEAMALGDRMLVFSQSLFTLNLIEDFLQRNNMPGKKEKWARNWNYYRLDGSTTALEREKLINEYNSNPNIHLFLVSTRAGSLGINLVGANRVVVFDASWNPCHDTQAVCRVYRYGQKKPCFVYRLVMDNCLEKKIYDRQINKQGMADRVVDELNPDAHLSIKEVSNLLWDNEEETEVKDFSKEKDKYIDVVLQKVLEKLSNSLSKEPFQHESLLIDRKDKKLSQAEKRLAKRSYELEKQANINYNRPMYTTYYPTQSGSASIPMSGLQIRAIRADGTSIPKPVASVRPMQSELTTQIEKGGLSQRATVTTISTGRSRWIPAEVWQRQGMSAQEMTLPLDVVIPTNSPDRASIVLKAGQRVMVLKSPKGIYMQLENGKIIAIRTAFKVGEQRKGSETQTKGLSTEKSEAAEVKTQFAQSGNQQHSGIELKKGVTPILSTNSISVTQRVGTVPPQKSSGITITPKIVPSGMTSADANSSSHKTFGNAGKHGTWNANTPSVTLTKTTAPGSQPTATAKPYYHHSSQREPVKQEYFEGSSSGVNVNTQRPFSSTNQASNLTKSEYRNYPTMSDNTGSHRESQMAQPSRGSGGVKQEPYSKQQDVNVNYQYNRVEASKDDGGDYQSSMYNTNYMRVDPQLSKGDSLMKHEYSGGQSNVKTSSFNKVEPVQMSMDPSQGKGNPGKSTAYSATPALKPYSEQPEKPQQQQRSKNKSDPYEFEDDPQSMAKVSGNRQVSNTKQSSYVSNTQPIPSAAAQPKESAKQSFYPDQTQSLKPQHHSAASSVNSSSNVPPCNPVPENSSVDVSGKPAQTDTYNNASSYDNNQYQSSYYGSQSSQGFSAPYYENQFQRQEEPTTRKDSEMEVSRSDREAKSQPAPSTNSRSEEGETNVTPYTSTSGEPPPQNYGNMDSTSMMNYNPCQYSLPASSSMPAGAFPNVPNYSPLRPASSHLTPPYPSSYSTASVGYNNMQQFGCPPPPQHDTDYGRGSMYSAFHRPEPHFAPSADVGSFLQMPPNNLPPSPFALPRPPHFPPSNSQAPNYYGQNMYSPYGRSGYGPPDPNLPGYSHPYTPSPQMPGFNPFLVHPSVPQTPASMPNVHHSYPLSSSQGSGASPSAHSESQSSQSQQ